MRFIKIELKERFPFLGEDGRNPVLAAYLPDAMAEMGWQDKKRPCMIICPGGGYAFCSAREAEPVALRFLGKGYNVFVLYYSVAPHTFPNQLREVAAAMELMYENQDSWLCDTHKVAILGFSAGGHLAAHYSTCFDIPQVREAFPDSKPVQASVLCYSVISADPAIAHLGSFCNLLGKESLKPEEVEAFSCDQRVTEKTPPAFLWHTSMDNAVPVENSLRYATALSRHNIPFALRVYPFGHHGLATVDSVTNHPLPQEFYHANEWMDAAIEWLDMIFA